MLIFPPSVQKLNPTVPLSTSPLLDIKSSSDCSLIAGSGITVCAGQKTHLRCGER